MVAVLASIEVLPVDTQVALLDRTWQDYPEWEAFMGWRRVPLRVSSSAGLHT
jgi:hypothetical protein